MKKVIHSLDQYLAFRRIFCLFCLLIVVGSFYCQFLRGEYFTGFAYLDQPRSASVILLWTTFFGRADFYFGLGRQPFLDQRCPVSNCNVTTDRSKAVSADAVVFHIRDLYLTDVPDQKLRDPDQRYVFFLLESPVNTDGGAIAKLRGFFNWTMTYRLDSDVVSTYGKVIPDQNLTASGKDEGKRKLVAWLVSNCHSKSGREDYVKRLGDYIQVDQFGRCGGKLCDEECERKLYKSYKFYLSFENSLCRDYVTEKLFKVLTHDVVPVVYGLGNYSALAPPHSYIDVADFESPRMLADYLRELDANDTAYNEYLLWKDSYGSESGLGHGFCELCKQLQQNGERKVYNDIYRWWFNGGESGEQSVCHTPGKII